MLRLTGGNLLSDFRLLDLRIRFVPPLVRSEPPRGEVAEGAAGWEMKSL